MTIQSFVDRNRSYKPRPWDVRRGLVTPEWRWAWDGLVALIPAWEGGGQPYEYISGQFATEETGDPDWFTTKYGTSRFYSDAEVQNDNYGHIDALDFGTGDFTVAAFVRNTKDGTISTFFSQGASGGDGPGWSLFVNGFNTGDDSARLELGDGTDGNNISSGSDAVPDSVPTLIAASRVNGTVHIYVDGVELASGNGDFDLSNSIDARTGAMDDDAGGETFQAQGQLITAYAWNHALTDGAHAQLARDPFGPFRPARRRMIRQEGTLHTAHRIPS